MVIGGISFRAKDAGSSANDVEESSRDDYGSDDVPNIEWQCAALSEERWAGLASPDSR